MYVITVHHGLQRCAPFVLCGLGCVLIIQEKKVRKYH